MLYYEVEIEDLNKQHLVLLSRHPVNSYGQLG